VELVIEVLVTVWAAVAFGAMVFESVHRSRRTNVLGGSAHGRHMRFAAEDPLDIPRRYRQFGLMQGGHDVWVGNVCDAPGDSGRARTFDLHVNVGRGGTSQCQRYAVAVIELARRIGPSPGATAGGGSEVVGQTVLAYVPMAAAPHDHAEALARATEIVASPPDR